ncbi:MAG: hypothetical protein IJ660_06045 [Alphaproteobacteria bacterium]|nr:hypothetical protein [Alphaproteobacteria bacterium]
MKKIALFCLGVLSCFGKAQAGEIIALEDNTPVSYMDEVKALGAVAGQGLACGSTRIDTFEMIARTILITKAKSNAEQAAGMRAYNDEKANAYISKQLDGFYECSQIVRRFDNQDVFNVKIYADGTIQMPDGALYTPRAPYDVTAVSQENKNQRKQAQKIYQNAGKRKIGKLKLNTGVDGATPPAYTGSNAPLIQY